MSEPKDVKYCRRCGRELKTSEAKERGMGRVCWKKSQMLDNKKPLFKNKL